MSLKKAVLVGSVIYIAVALRLLAALHGHNYDFESYLLVGDIIEKGKVVYSETSRYNYGPIWFMLIGLLQSLASLFVNPEIAFRIFICLLLTWADLGIALILFRDYGLRAFTLMLLNPISIIITGYHAQFDNLAVFVALLGLVSYGDELGTKMNQRKWLGIILLGVSISLKHVFLFFPIWLAIKEKKVINKRLVFYLPVLIFVLSLLPFLIIDFQSVWENVIIYNSAKNTPLLSSFLSLSKINYTVAMVFWLFVITLFGFVFRRRSLLSSGVLYLLIFLVFSPSVINHHLTLAVPAIAVFPNILFGLFSFVGGYMLLLDKLGMNITQLVEAAPDIFLYKQTGIAIFKLPIIILFVGLIMFLIKQRHLIKMIVKTEVDYQRSALSA